MRNAVVAVLYHYSDITRESIRHQFCPMEQAVGANGRMTEQLVKVL